MQTVDKWYKEHTVVTGKVIKYTKFKLIKTKYAKIYIKRR